MNILALDVTGKKAYVTSKINNKITSDEDTSNVTHSEKLLPLIHKNIQNNNIDLIITTNGPGSFTGCRIGIATVKGLAHVNNTKIIAISSLELLAFSEYFNNYLKQEKYILSIINARNNRVYYALFKFNYIDEKTNIEKIIDIDNDDFNEVLKKLESFKEIVITGETSEFNIKSENLISSSTSLNSKHLLDYYDNVSNLNYTNYTDLDVVYARMSQAERLKNGNNKS